MIEVVGLGRPPECPQATHEEGPGAHDRDQRANGAEIERLPEEDPVRPRQGDEEDEHGEQSQQERDAQRHGGPHDARRGAVERHGTESQRDGEGHRQRRGTTGDRVVHERAARPDQPRRRDRRQCPRHGDALQVAQHQATGARVGAWRGQRDEPQRAGAGGGQKGHGQRIDRQGET